MMVLGRPVPVIPQAPMSLALNGLKRWNDRLIETGLGHTIDADPQPVLQGIGSHLG